LAEHEKDYAVVGKKYKQKSIIERIEALFLDNVGKVVTRDNIIEVARDPETGADPENWHQRLSELRTDYGYTILSKRDRSWLKVGEYVMVTKEKKDRTSSRTLISEEAWQEVLKRAGNRCEWNNGTNMCGLGEGEIDPVGGGTVHLTPDHKSPHASGKTIDPNNPQDWQALCGRHQVMKKHFWDDRTGKINTYAVVQAAPEREKRIIYGFLKSYFGDE